MSRKSYMAGLLAGMLLVLLPGCGEKKREYASADDYPVRTDDLAEMVYSPGATRFCVWAPAAEDVRVMLYESGEEGNAYKILKLEPEEDGTWTGSQEGDLKGKFYTFNAKVNGRWLGDTPGIMAEAVGVNGKRAAIVRPEDAAPEGWEKDVAPAWKSGDGTVLYRLDLQAFSADTASGIRQRGHYLSLTEQGTRNSAGMPTGIDHLKELGVTHVVLMPCFDFAGKDEIPGGAETFSRGSGPLNFNVPEGAYATDARTPEVRIREYKQLVQALHTAGIRVLMDVTYSYTSGAPGSSFERTAPGYFYRNLPEKGAVAGAEISNEIDPGRPMMRRFMIESLRRWVREYHIDGFCFDRMGSLDTGLMNEVSRALDRESTSLFLCGRAGEPRERVAGAGPMAVENNAGLMPGIAVYHEIFSEGVFGNKRAGGKFLYGLSGGDQRLRSLIAGDSDHPQPQKGDGNASRTHNGQPSQQINGLGGADGRRPADKLDAALPAAERAALYKLAQTILFTSQGVPLIQAGDEWMMSDNGRDPGRLRPLDWNSMTAQQDVLEYCKGLISLRKHHPAFRMRTSAEVARHLEFLPAEGVGLLAYRLKAHAGGDPWEEIIVVLNSNKAPVKMNIPEGTYTVVCRNGQIDLSGMGQLYGGEIFVAGQSALIIYK